MGGVILVGRWTPGEMTAATQQLRAAGCATGRPLLLMVDQEGGYARRLTWAPPEHTAGQLGRLGAASTRAEAIGAAIGLRRAGIDIDLAPVYKVWLAATALGPFRAAIDAHPKLVMVSNTSYRHSTEPVSPRCSHGRLSPACSAARSGSAAWS
jgi:hypothetical protein